VRANSLRFYFGIVVALARNAVSQTPAANAWTHGLGLLL
jgi:hypothetical protein